MGGAQHLSRCEQPSPLGYEIMALIQCTRCHRSLWEDHMSVCLLGVWRHAVTHNQQPTHHAPPSRRCTLTLTTRELVRWVSKHASEVCYRVSIRLSTVPMHIPYPLVQHNTLISHPVLYNAALSISSPLTGAQPDRIDGALPLGERHRRSHTCHGSGTKPGLVRPKTLRYTYHK